MVCDVGMDIWYGYMICGLWIYGYEYGYGCGYEYMDMSENKPITC